MQKKKSTEQKTTATDKVAGKLKQVAAEVIGDGKLAEEGKQQENGQRDERGPIEGLNKLT